VRDCVGCMYAQLNFAAWRQRLQAMTLRLPTCPRSYGYRGAAPPNAPLLGQKRLECPGSRRLGSSSGPSDREILWDQGLCAIIQWALRTRMSGPVRTRLILPRQIRRPSRARRSRSRSAGESGAAHCSRWSFWDREQITRRPVAKPHSRPRPQGGALARNIDARSWVDVGYS
jgi:hypothetical protein